MIDRLLCEQIPAESIPDAVRQELSVVVAEVWDTSLPPVVALRSTLMKAQRYRCAYCQCSIGSDQGGLRELDHVLPKEISAHCDSRKCTSNAFADRRQTIGYWQFAYEWRNLVVTCKQCNTNKGSFDPLLIRPDWNTVYPDSGESFLWIHPHFHSYSDHIRITEHWLYERRTHEGDAVIRVCKLDKAEVLARRKVVQSFAAQARSLKKFLHMVSGRHTELDPTQCVQVLEEEFGIPHAMGERLVEVWFSHGNEISSESLSKALTLTQEAEQMLADDSAKAPVL